MLHFSFLLIFPIIINITTHIADKLQYNFLCIQKKSFLIFHSNVVEYFFYRYSFFFLLSCLFWRVLNYTFVMKHVSVRVDFSFFIWSNDSSSWKCFLFRLFRMWEKWDATAFSVCIGMLMHNNFSLTVNLNYHHENENL